jgi:hypothetical protein
MSAPIVIYADRLIDLLQEARIELDRDAYDAFLNRAAEIVRRETEAE